MKESALINKLHREALKPEQTVFADEDTVTYTRQEVRALWTIMQRGLDQPNTIATDDTVPTQPIRVRSFAYFTATWLGSSEFYSGIRNGERVTLKVENMAYSHDPEKRVKCSSPSLSIQSIENPGGWLCLYDSYEKLSDIEPA